ncbi:MAG: DnaA/Hda family protein [Candidatus Portnoybacteria bacterium]|nr:DnaA/Hda family protein [Candidatus Portnoybacteria bacterium]
MTNNELWQLVLNEVQLSISKPNFTTWFKNTNIISQKNGEIIIGVPNGFTREWLENKYNKIIISALRNSIGRVKTVKYIISSSLKPTQEIKEKRERKSEEKKTLVLKEQLDIQEYKIDETTNLNPRYTFDSFVVASFNELAHAAARSVINDLGKVYNPLFIYGGVGVGKTHLIQAIGNEVVKNKGKTIIYVSSEKFSADLITSISEGKVEEFKNKYRKTDVLIIDDIQFLAGKEKTQEIFFHTFNHLYEKNKQIIISSDRPGLLHS